MFSCLSVGVGGEIIIIFFLQEQSKPGVHKLMSLVKSILYQILTTLFEQMDPNSPPSK